MPIRSDRANKRNGNRKEKRNEEDGKITKEKGGEEKTGSCEQLIRSAMKGMIRIMRVMVIKGISKN